MYTVTVLSSQDFDDLPKSITRGSDISDSLGFADVLTKKAYVRNTNWEELNDYLVDHELEHFIEKHATDQDENGLRHKKGGFFGNYLKAIDPFNTLGTHGGAPLSGSGDALKGGIGGFVGSGFNPIGFVTGAEGANLASLGKQPQQASYQGGGGMDNLFGSQGGISQLSQSSLGQGFGQTSAFSPSGSGQGGQSAPMANMGLAALPNGANISNGQQNSDQRQSGFWNPTYKF